MAPASDNPPPVAAESVKDVAYWQRLAYEDTRNFQQASLGILREISHKQTSLRDIILWFLAAVIGAGGIVIVLMLVLLMRLS